MCGRTESSLSIQLSSHNAKSSHHKNISDVYISSVDPSRNANTTFALNPTVYEDPLDQLYFSDPTTMLLLNHACLVLACLTYLTEAANRKSTTVRTKPPLNS